MLFTPLDAMTSNIWLQRRKIFCLTERWRHDAVGGHPWLGRSCDSLLGRWTFPIWGHRGRKVTTFNPCHLSDTSHKSPPRLSLKFHIFISHQNKTLSCSSCFVKLQPDAAVPVKQLDTEPEQNWVRKQNKPKNKQTTKFSNADWNTKVFLSS